MTDSAASADHHRSPARSRWVRAQRVGLPIAIPFLAAVVGLAFGAIMLLLVGADPISSYGALVDGAIGDRNSISDTLVKATPLLFVGVGICVAFRAGTINIGGEGQFIMGAVFATFVALNLGALPGPVIILFAAAAGVVGGGIWGGIAGSLKARLGVNEILSTVMLNVIAALFMNYLVAGPLIDPRQVEQGTRIPETERFPRKADLPRLMEPTRLHLGIVIAILVAVAIWVLLWRTPLGFRIRAVGLNPHAARYAGMSVQKNAMMALTASGALAGLGGAIQVLGLDHRLYSEGNAAAFTGLAGFNGIVVALFGGLHPLGAIPASVLFGGLIVGANNLQRTAQVPSSLAVTLNGVVVLAVVSSQFWLHRRRRKLDLAEIGVDEEPISGDDGDAVPDEIPVVSGAPPGASEPADVTVPDDGESRST